VYPVAQLPLRALGAGATVAHVNSIRFEVSSQEQFLEGPASSMQALVMKVFAGMDVRIVVVPTDLTAAKDDESFDHLSA